MNAPGRKPIPRNLDLRTVESTLKAMAHWRRLLILRELRRRREMHVGELSKVLKIPLKTVSRNLRLLERVGLVISDPRGVYVYYRLNLGVPPFVRLILEALSKADRVIL